MSNASITLSFDDLQNASNHNFAFFQNVAIDVNGIIYSLSTYLFITSFALSEVERDYSAIADSFSSALEPLGISMDNTGIITLKLASFATYVQTVLKIDIDEIDIYSFFRDYIKRSQTVSETKKAIAIALNV